MWWETYHVTHPIEDLDWDSFREGFHNAHISVGIMNLKKDEFRTLKQGGMRLKEYMDDFCSLSRYAPEDIDTDSTRKDKFLNGLKGELKIPLSVAYAPSYQALLDQAITLDNNIRKEENRKRKFNNGKTHAEHSHKRHHSYEGNGNGSNYNGHKHNGGNKETTPMDIRMEAMVTTMEAMETIIEAMEITMEAMRITMEEMDNTTPTRWL
jgi:hypothetical protein